ncbi:hypothetical protein GCM10022252_50830 [Streptosporangium oxazolinicum]|uniref:ABC transporter permease n=1 Tax=Streptosporangium oxazolinicum TaxID=909287 RepID=A0ABP8B6V2_9ACTN
MSGRLEACYRRLLLLYPKDYRDRHGEELIGTLILASRRDTASIPRRPLIREMAALMSGAFAAHALEARRTRAPWWADGLHLAVLALIVAEFSMAGPARFPLGTETSIALLLLVTLGWVRPALPLALFVFEVLTPLEPSIRSHVIVVGLAVLAVRPGKGLTRRSWTWALIPAFFWLPSVGRFGLYAHAPWAQVSTGIDVLLLGAALWATLIARDPRWTLASAIYAGTGLVLFQFDGQWAYLPWHSTRDYLYWGLVSLLVTASVVAARRTRRRI